MAGRHENEKKLKLADQNSSEIRYLKEQVCNLKKEVHTLEKEAESLKEEKIPVQRKGETHLKQTDSRAHRPGSEIDRLKQVILQLEYENEKHKSHISTISGAKENALQRQSQAELNIKTLEEEIQRLRERLLKQEDDNYRLQKEISEVCKEKDNALSRLSKVAGAKLYHGNAAVTDLSDSNRPTKIAEKFSELYDNQWTDAFEELKNTYNTEEETIQVLLNILQEAYTFCMKAENYYETRIDEAVFTLTDVNTEETRRINGTNSSIQKALADLRLSMGNACSSIIGQMFLAKLPAILKKKLDVSVSPKTKLYARQCANLCWRMRIRLPPVFARFEFGKGTTFNTDILRKYTKTGGYLDFVVWPALYLHENGPVLSKGVAQPKHFP
ncbi:uncharacterized protein LOC133192937 [Saccostrea echinata]|uniref:uncharacterized protein LOC133192937 n=1 Tax=Saccostrea echinata TaxID=191078 RepID=UPI002A81A549|nr:uncharacterized protein LOC133192937 [Saccostrea echinata]